jgi:hypothetical protein
MDFRDWVPLRGNEGVDLNHRIKRAEYHYYWLRTRKDGCHKLFLEYEGVNMESKICVTGCIFETDFSAIQLKIVKLMVKKRGVGFIL